MSSAHIFVAEDEIHTRVTLELILKKEGFCVTSEGNGATALKRICEIYDADKSIDLILLDIRMPGLNGTEVLTRLIKKKLGIPVLVITGYADKVLLKKLADLDCNRIIEKPFPPYEIIQLVREIINQPGNGA